MSEQLALRPPLVLIASDQEWSTRALESILGPQGYAVLRAFNGRQALDQVVRGHPDIVIVFEQLPDASGLEICRTLRADGMVTDSTAILLMFTGKVAHEARLAALRVGASDCFGLPLDGEEFGLRLMSYARAKFDADRAREHGLVDPPTGLYNSGGLARRAREIGSQAYRHGSPLACVVFSPSQDDEGDVTEAVIRIAEALSRDGRVSDVIGRVGKNEVAVFAPETPAEGAQKLVDRLQAAIERRAAENGKSTGVPPRTGYFAVPNFRETPIEPSEMLRRASAAMRDFKPVNGNARTAGRG